MLEKTAMANNKNNSLPLVVSSFLLGVGATLAAGLVVRRLGYNDASATTTTKSTPVFKTCNNGSSTRNTATSTSTTTNTRTTKSNDVMDSPNLDLRLIRKAEAVIQWRAGGLTVVIERSTNSWNHSAILRTAEALVS